MKRRKFLVSLLLALLMLPLHVFAEEPTSMHLLMRKFLHVDSCIILL